MISNRLVVLTYHRVLEAPDQSDPDETDLEQFELQVATLARFFRVLPLADAVSSLQSGSLPARAVSITFDDGYRDNVTAALPVLEKHGVPATFFVASGYIDGGIMWNDRVIESVRRFGGETMDLQSLGLGVFPVSSEAQRTAALKKLLGEIKYRQQQERDTLCDSIAERLGVTLPRDLMMRGSDLKALRNAGMEIGGHTRSHPILRVAPDDAAAADIRAGKEDLEQIIGERISSFAYPNGRPGQDYDSRHVAMVREAGFSQAVTTASGCVSRESDPLQLGRLSIWHRSRPKLLLRMMMNFFAGDAATV